MFHFFINPFPVQSIFTSIRFTQYHNTPSLPQAEQAEQLHLLQNSAKMSSNSTIAVVGSTSSYATFASYCWTPLPRAFCTNSILIVPVTLCHIADKHLSTQNSSHCKDLSHSSKTLVHTLLLCQPLLQIKSKMVAVVWQWSSRHSRIHSAMMLPPSSTILAGNKESIFASRA